METEFLRIHSLDLHGSASDGPGIRAVVFFQGCTRHCLGCHNVATWALDGGIIMTVREIVSRIVAANIYRVTISGGEPLLQPDGVVALVQKLKEVGINDLCLYTGFDEKDVPEDVLACIKGAWLKTGAFRLSERTSVKPFVGSFNQEFRRVA